MTNSPCIERETEKDVKNLYARMTPLERELIGRAGTWEFKHGRHYDPGLSRYVLKCANCRHYFTAKRPDAKTCGEACKKARQRACAKANFAKSEQSRF